MTKDKEKTSEVELADEVTDSSIDEVVVTAIYLSSIGKSSAGLISLRILK